MMYLYRTEHGLGTRRYIAHRINPTSWLDEPFRPGYSIKGKDSVFNANQLKGKTRKILRRMLGENSMAEYIKYIQDHHEFHRK